MIIASIVITIVVVVGVLYGGHDEASPPRFCRCGCDGSMYKDTKKKRLRAIAIGTPIIIAVSLIVFWGSGMLFQKILSRQYQDEISKAERDRTFVQEFLVDNSPELSGVEPKEVVFDSDDDIRMTVTAPVSFTVKDATSYAMLKSYYEKWKDFDAASVIRMNEKIGMTVVALIMTAAAGLIMSFMKNPYSYIFYASKEEVPDYIGDLMEGNGI